MMPTWFVDPRAQERLRRFIGTRRTLAEMRRFFEELRDKGLATEAVSEADEDRLRQRGWFAVHAADAGELPGHAEDLRARGLGLRAEFLDLPSLAEGLFAKAKRLLRRDKQLVPVAFIVAGNGMVEMSVLKFSSPAEKERAYAQLSVRCREVKATAVICLNESWVVERQSKPGATMDEIRAEAEADVEPSRDPKHVEALTMFVLGPGFAPTLRLLPFTQRGRRIVFGPEREQKLTDEVAVLMVPRWWDEARFPRQ